MSYDATEMEFVKHLNGFDIRFNDKDRYEFVVFHPSYSTVYIDAFQTISEAEEFCEEEDSSEWYERLYDEVQYGVDIS